MSVLTYQVGTRPTTTYVQVTLNSTGWTPLWGLDLTRTFASVLGGTSAAGEKIYVTHDPNAAITDATVAICPTDIRGALYFETRGTNALYARVGSGTLPVRTTRTTQTPLSPLPNGLLGIKDYGINTTCGHLTPIYVNSRYAPVLLKDSTRLRATLFGNSNNIMLAGKFDDPSVLALLTITAFNSSGPFFPGPLAVEGIDGIELIDVGNGQQTQVSWISDNMVSL